MLLVLHTFILYLMNHLFMLFCWVDADLLSMEEPEPICWTEQGRINLQGGWCSIRCCEN
uniref:Uncharacterized protein n=1 Tax=Oryza brachyantha TaxID=4533 RepID=J3NCV9_ORYBR